MERLAVLLFQDFSLIEASMTGELDSCRKCLRMLNSRVTVLDSTGESPMVKRLSRNFPERTVERAPGYHERSRLELATESPSKECGKAKREITPRSITRMPE
jgi:hypothetical protein